MGESYDVVVVGGRCAGSPLATKLARAGMDVALVDRARFPSDTLSTHIFQNEGVVVLEDLGVLDRVLATGAPWLEHVDGRADDVRFGRPWPRRMGDPGPGLCVRRPLLDAILLHRAEEAGVRVRTETTAVGLIGTNGRVAGVRVRTGDRESDLWAPLVVGADGRVSTIARLTGARSYNTFPSQRLGFWGYYEGARWSAPATLYFHRWDEEFVIACPADSGLYLVVVIAPSDRAGEFRSGMQAAFEAHVARCQPVGAIVGGARLLGRPRAALGWTCYFREAAGPGWALVGDAGHFKDPSMGQGISDALRQADQLAAAIVVGMDGTGPLDRSLSRWWRWRDGDAAEAAWFAADVGQDGRVPAPLGEIVRQLVKRDELEPFLDIFNHRTRPSEVLTPARLLGTTSRLLRRGDRDRREVLRETSRILGNDLRRRRLNRRPVYGV